MTPTNGTHPFTIEDPDAAPTARTGLPVAVIGAGPVGLAAAAHLLDQGLEPLVLEAGPQVGANIAQWRHVRLFSPWCLALDPVSVRLLDQAGWTGPDPDALPTGADLLERYLAPLAALPTLTSRIRLNTTVVAVARPDLDKVRSPGRGQLPFLVRVRDRHGRLADLRGAGGDRRLRNLDPAQPARRLGAARPGRARRKRQDRLRAARHPRPRPQPLCGTANGGGRGWPFRRHQPARPSRAATAGAGHRGRVGGPLGHPRPLVGKGSAEADELPARGRLATDLAALVEDGRIELVSGFRIHTLESAGNRVRLAGDHMLGEDVLQGQDLVVEADAVIAATGFRPDHAIADELRLDLDPALECPTALAPLIDPNVHTCGTVPAHGIAELAQPEPGYVIVGMKSYGRAPTFLLATGYQQVRSVAAALAGDPAAAARRDQGPPAAAMCARNRDRLARPQRRHRLVPSVPTIPRPQPTSRHGQGDGLR